MENPDYGHSTTTDTRTPQTMSRTTLNQPATATRSDELKYLEEQGRIVAVDLVETAKCSDIQEEPFAHLERMDDVFSKIRSAASEGNPTEDLFNEQANLVTKAMLRELNSLVKQEEAIRGHQAAFDLAVDIRQIYFSSSPNVTGLASAIHIIPEVSLLCQNPIVQGSFGPSLVAELSLSLGFGSPESAYDYGKKAAEILDSSADSLAERLDMVAQLKTIVAESYNTWSSYTPEFAEGIISGLSQRDDRPILSYALQSVEQFISRERDEPSLPLVRQSIGAFEHARSDIVTEQEIARDRVVRSQLVLDVPGRPQRVAQNAFVLVDQSNTGNYLALIDGQSRLPDPSYDAYMLALLKDELQNTQPQNFPEKLLRLTFGSDRNLLKLGTRCIEQNSQETLAMLLEKSGATFELVCGFIEAFEKKNLAAANLQDAIYYKMNRSLVEMLIKDPEDVSLSYDHPDYIEMEKSALSGKENPTAENLESAAEAIKSNLSQQRLRAIAYRIEQEIGIEIDPDLESAAESANDQFRYQAQLVSESANQIIPDFVAGIEHLEEEVRRVNSKPEVLKYEELFARHDIFPFDARFPESDALLLRHLQNPTIRIPLEQDLGIELSSIPLRTQLHFLRALSSHDDKQFETLKTQLQKLAPDERKLLVQCYLVAAEEPDLGRYVLNVAEGIDDAHRTKVFESYVNLVKASDRLASSLIRTSGALGIEYTDIEEQRIATQKRILQRANTLFESFVKLDRKDWISLAEFFESESADITTFAGTFATLKEHLKDDEGAIALEKIPGVAINVHSATELSPEHKEQMHTAYKRSLLAYPPGFRPLAYGEFCEALEADSLSRSHTVTFNDQIVCFLRMDPTADGYYMASVNTSALVNGFGIGTPLLKGVIDSYPSENISLAYVEGTEQVASLYQKPGFSASGSIENAGGSGTRVYKMTNSFFMKPNMMGPFPVLEVGFNMNIRTTGDKVLKDAVYGLHQVEMGSGEIIGVNGRCSLLVAAAMAEDLHKQFDTVAFWNPDISTYVVAVSRNPDVPQGSLIGTDGTISPPLQITTGDSYRIERGISSSDDGVLLNIGFNTETRAGPAQTIVDAIAALDQLNLERGTLIKLNGRANLPVIAALSERLSDRYDAIAIYDPKIPGEEKYVITHTSTSQYAFGNRIS